MIKFLTKTVMVACALLVACTVDDATRIERAKQNIADQEFRSAMIELKNVLRANPDNIDARVMLGKSLLGTGDVESALKELRRARELGGSPDEYMLPMARALFREGRYGEVAELNASEMSDPMGQAAILAMMGRAESSLDNPTAAQRHFEAALKLDSNQSDALIGLAGLARVQNNSEQSQKYLEQLLQLDPNNHEALAAMGRLSAANNDYEAAEQYLADALAAATQPSQAIERMNYQINLIDVQLAQENTFAAQRTASQLLKSTQEHPIALLNAARVDYASKDYDAVIDKTQRVVTAFPQAEPARLLLAAAAMAKGNRNLAATNLQAIVNMNPGDQRARKMLAQVRMDMGSPEDALELLQPLLARGGDDPQVLAMASAASIRSGQSDSGVDLIERGLELGSSDPAILMQAAANFMAAGEIDRAIEVLESIPESKQGDQRDMLLILAQLRKGDKDAARAKAQSILDSRPGDPIAHRVMGGLHLALAEFDQARAQFVQALKLDPKDVFSVISLARIDVTQKKPEQAEQRMRAALENNPGNLMLMTALARLVEANGDLQGGVAILEQAREANPAELGPALTLANYYLRKGDLPLAKERAEQASRNDPNSGSAQSMLGRIFLKEGRDSEALASFEKAIELDPKVGIAHVYLGQAQQKLGMNDQAMASFDRAAELNPKLYQAGAAKIALLMERGDFKSALASAKTMMSNHPGRAEPVAVMGEIELARGDNKAALAAFEQAMSIKPNGRTAARIADVSGRLGQAEPWKVLQDWVEKNPADRASKKLLAETYSRFKEPEKAIVLLEQMMKEQPDLQPALGLGVLHNQLGQLDKAVSRFEQALKLKPDSVQAQAALSNIEMRRGNNDRALALARKLREQQPGVAGMHRLEGDALAALEQYGDSIKAYERALELEPSGETTSRLYAARAKAGIERPEKVLEDWLSDHPGDVQVVVQLAQVYDADGRIGDAIAAYRRALDKDDKHIIALNNLAWLYYKRNGQGDLRRGVDAAASAYQQRQDLPPVTDTYGWLLLQSGETEKALPLLRAAANASGRNEIVYHYAAALHKVGNTDEARAMLDRALASGATFEGIEDARKLRQQL